MLKNYFYAKQHLRCLIQDYVISPLITVDTLLNCSENVTFIAVLQGTADKTVNLNPLFVKDDSGDWIRTNETVQHVIVTKDYLDYLRREFNFQITSISSVFFYKRCPTFNAIFQHLITLRADPQISPCRKQLLKKIINYSTGYFGFNQNKSGATCHKIVSKITKHYDITRHALTMLPSIDQHDYYIKTTYKMASPCIKKCPSPLPLYCFIVEYGKMKMSQFLTFLDYFLDSKKYRHLYSNTDNLIIALSTSTVQQAVKPHLQDWFEIEKTCIFSDSEPGHLEQEFYFEKESNWKFVSPVMQNYSILAENTQGLHKSSVFSKLCSATSYQYSLQLLKNESVTFSQPRRMSKIANTQVHDQTFIVKLKE